MRRTPEGGAPQEGNETAKRGQTFEQALYEIRATLDPNVEKATDARLAAAFEAIGEVGEIQDTLQKIPAILEQYPVLKRYMQQNVEKLVGAMEKLGEKDTDGESGRKVVNEIAERLKWAVKTVLDRTDWQVVDKLNELVAIKNNNLTVFDDYIDRKLDGEKWLNPALQSMRPLFDASPTNGKMDGALVTEAAKDAETENELKLCLGDMERLAKSIKAAKEHGKKSAEEDLKALDEIIDSYINAVSLFARGHGEKKIGIPRDDHNQLNKKYGKDVKKLFSKYGVKPQIEPDRSYYEY